jgi:hypothetical protein
MGLFHDPSRESKETCMDHADKFLSDLDQFNGESLPDSLMINEWDVDPEIEALLTQSGIDF